MEELHFDSTDLAATEEFLVEAYTKMRIGGHAEHARTRIDRRWMGPVSLDRLSFSFDMQFNVRPLNKVLIGRVHSGYIESRFAGIRDVFHPGDVMLIAPPDEAYAGLVSKATYDAVMFDTEQLNRVGAPTAGARGQGVRLTGHRPMSRVATAQLSALLSYLQDRVPNNPGMRDSPLVASTAAMHLASVVLETFPTNAQLEPTAADRNGAKAALLRKAIAYIDEAAHTDISIVDIAASVNMTPRGVQYMFRRELDCPPMEYVRRVRLEHAHRDLTSAGPDSTTVAQVATRWGFAHKGRFARSYRQVYGRTPHETLHA